MEIWKDIPGYKGRYQVSSIGRVKSLKRLMNLHNSNKKRVVHEKILKPSSIGYLRVVFSTNGVYETYQVHQLVAMAFLGHKLSGMSAVIDHIDNNPLNNNVENLQIVSHRKNTSKDKKGTSKYTGVSWSKRENKWESCIYYNGSKRFLGYFEDEIIAAKKYNNELSKIENYG